MEFALIVALGCIPLTAFIVAQAVLAAGKATVGGQSVDVILRDLDNKAASERLNVEHQKELMAEAKARRLERNTEAMSS